MGKVVDLRRSGHPIGDVLDEDHDRPSATRLGIIGRDVPSTGTGLTQPGAAADLERRVLARADRRRRIEHAPSLLARLVEETQLAHGPPDRSLGRPAEDRLGAIRPASDPPAVPIRLDGIDLDHRERRRREQAVQRARLRASSRVPLVAVRRFRARDRHGRAPAPVSGCRPALRTCAASPARPPRRSGVRSSSRSSSSLTARNRRRPGRAATCGNTHKTVPAVATARPAARDSTTAVGLGACHHSVAKATMRSAPTTARQIAV